jgi:hypothetical protein
MKNIIEKIAFDLFREWTKKAVNDFPDLSFTIIDERKIVRDFKTAFSTAIKINTLYHDYYELLTNLDPDDPKISQKIIPK